MTLSSGVSICGVSACITAAGVAGTDDRKLSYVVSLVLIVVVPMIYLMPWLAAKVVPLVASDPAVQQEIAGAWIGGTIDTTSGVAASSAMAGELANSTAIIVKATQNVLIGVVAFFIALYLSTRGEGGRSRQPSLGIVWEKFPKFILGFVAASLLFSLCQSFEVFPTTPRRSSSRRGWPRLSRRFSSRWPSSASASTPGSRISSRRRTAPRCTLFWGRSASMPS